MLDRMTEKRTDERWLEGQLARACIVPIWRGQHLFSADGAQPLFPRWSIAGPFDEWIFLGIRDERDPFVAVEILDADDESEALARIGYSAADARWVGARDALALADAEDLDVLNYGRAMTHWHRNQRFCSVCGAPAAPRDGGHVRVCTAEGTTFYPRSDPATIMLVHDGGERALLGRKAEWPPRRYSTLAGFVEPGETLEMAVVREVREESGIVVDPGGVQYFASQPWPFPQSLMLGFYARASNDTVAVGEELEDARWFTRDEIVALTQSGALALPGVDTIARRLVDGWLRRTEGLQTVLDK